jgi:hypothetical protein
MIEKVDIFKFIQPVRKIQCLEDAERVILEIQTLATMVFSNAIKNGWHQELALYSMTLKDKIDAEISKIEGEKAKEEADK